MAVGPAGSDDLPASPDTVVKIPDRDEYRRRWAKLDGGERRQIVKAVNRGQAVDDPRKAALAVQTARGQQRFWAKAWWFGPIASLFALTQGWAVYVVNAVLATALLVLMSWFWLRRARRAEEANAAVAAGRKKGRRAGDQKSGPGSAGGRGSGGRKRGPDDHLPRKRSG